MRSWKRSVLVSLIAFWSVCPAGAVVITGSADSYVDSMNPTVMYGGSLTMNITSHSYGLLRFVLSSVPAGTTSSQIAKATLQLWEIPDSPNNSGSISIYELTSDFVASTVTYNTRPSMASLPIATVSALANSRYIEIDITSLVQKWIATPSTNHGIAILPASSSMSLDLLLGTKWNTAESQPPILDITVFAPPLPGPQGPAGPQGPIGPQGPQGPSVSTGPAFALCSAGATSPLSCSCTHLLSQIQVKGVTDGSNNILSNGTCTANTATNPCSTAAISTFGSWQSNTTYYGICCVCN